MKVNIENKSYENMCVLRNISLDFKPGNLYCLSGVSGCGKSTLLNIIAGHDKEFVGDYIVDDYQVSFVSQTTYLIEQFTVLENLELSGNTEDIDNLLQHFECFELKNQKCSKLSGGQRQRVAIIRGILSNAKYLLLDEPTSNLDSNNSLLVIQLVKELTRKYNVCIILTTHDNSILKECDYVYKYKDKNFISDVKTPEYIDEITQKGTTKFDIDKIFNKYFKRYFIKNVGYIVLNTLIFTILFIALISLNLFLRSDYDEVMDSISPDYIGITKTADRNGCEEDNSCYFTREYNDLTFTNDQIDELKNLEGVEEVVETPIPIPQKVDNDGNKLQFPRFDSKYYDTSKLNYLKPIRRNILIRNKNLEEAKKPISNVLYSFSSVDVPSEYLSLYGKTSIYYNLTNIEYGTNQFNDVDEIVIPLHLAYIYAEQKGVNVEDLINTEISLPIFTKQNQLDKKTYKIIGIYNEKSSKSFNDLGKIFVSTKVSLTSENLYDSLVAQYSRDQKFSHLYPNYNEFIKGNTTPIQSVILKVSPQNSEEVQKVIDQEYSENKIFDKNKYRYENFKKYKLRPLVFLIATIIVGSILAIITTIFINKLAIKARENDITVFKILSIPDSKINKFYLKYRYMNVLISSFIFCTVAIVILSLT